MELEQQLRDALHAGGAELHLHGAGAEAVRRRAYRRRHRACRARSRRRGRPRRRRDHRAGQHRPADDTLVSLGGGAAAPGRLVPELVWRVVEGTVAFPSVHLSTVGGVTYALSTAPGTKGSPYGYSPAPQAVYRTRDGERWEVATIAGGGELDRRPFRARWCPLRRRDRTRRVRRRSRLPPRPLDRRRRPVGRDDAAVAAHGAPRLGPALPWFQRARGHRSRHHRRRRSERYWPELQDLLAARFGRATAPGGRAERLGWVRGRGPDRLQARRGRPSMPGSRRGTLCGRERPRRPGPRPAGRRRPPRSRSPTPTSRRRDRRRAGPARVPKAGRSPASPSESAPSAWADIGLHRPRRPRGPDGARGAGTGGDWQTTDLPATPGEDLVDVVATSNGFVAVVQGNDDEGSARSQVWASDDGLSWVLRSTAPAGTGYVPAAGDRLLAVDGQVADRLVTSADAGRTWAEVPLGDLVPGGLGLEPVVAGSYVGPLGFAVLVVSVGDGKDGVNGQPVVLQPGRRRLVDHRPGRRWCARRRLAVAGGRGRRPRRRHLHRPGEGAGGRATTTVLLATPKG